MKEQLFKPHRDANNSPISLGRLVRAEPEWAVSMIREYREKILGLQGEMESWKDASGLERGGDPDGVTPHAFKEYWVAIENRMIAAEGKVGEIAAAFNHFANSTEQLQSNIDWLHISIRKTLGEPWQGSIEKKEIKK